MDVIDDTITLAMLLVVFINGRMLSKKCSLMKRVKNVKNCSLN